MKILPVVVDDGPCCGLLVSFRTLVLLHVGSYEGAMVVPGGSCEEG